MHHAYSLLKIGCNQTMRVILLGKYTLFAWYVFYFIQVFFFFFENLVFTIFDKHLCIKNILLVIVFIGKFQGRKNKFNFKTTKE